ncbi:MAG: hypothetical protein ABL998_20780, partial [Planctomycetota bacterium]
ASFSRSERVSTGAASMPRTWNACSRERASEARVVLRDSEHRGQASLALAESLARTSLGADANGARLELLGLLEEARELLEAAHASR